MYDFNSDPRFKGIEKFRSKVWISSPTMHGDEQRWVDEAIQTNWVSTVGANINEVEKEAAKIIGRPYAVALSAGTAALHLAIRLAGEKLYGPAVPNQGVLAGRRVFASDMTFDATVNPVCYEGGELVFIDSSYDDWNMDPAALEKAFEIYPDVKLIVVAHLYGTPGNVEEIRRIADEHGALIVEDAAESFGSTYFIPSSSPLFNCYSNNVGVGKHTDVGADAEKKRSGDLETNANGEKGLWIQTGCFGDISIISFNGNKIITGSSGGMLLCDEKSDADKIRKWSTQAREAASWYQHEELGYNYRMSNIIAGVVRGQLPYLGEHIEQKATIYRRYREGLKDLPVSMNPIPENVVPNYWLSCMLIDEEYMAPFVRGEKDELWQSEPGKSSPGEILAAISSFGAEGRPIWKPMHLQPVYRGNVFISKSGITRGRSNAYIDEKAVIDVSADIFQRGLCLPSDNKMTVEQQDRIIEIIHRCFE